MEVFSTNKIGLIKKLRRAWNALSKWSKIKTGLVEIVAIFFHQFESNYADLKSNVFMILLSFLRLENIHICRTMSTTKTENHLKLSQTTRNHLQPAGDYLKPSATTQKSPETICNHSGTTWNPSKPPKTSCNQPKTSKNWL